MLGGCYQSFPSLLECVFTGPQLDNLPTTQTLVSFVEHSILGEEREEKDIQILIMCNRRGQCSSIIGCCSVLAVTCPGVRALTGWESEIHTEPSMFSVTVQGTGTHRKVVFS